jgi:hypothetical protein
MRLLFTARSSRRLKYVLIELLVITFGLLIALAIDNLVEWRQHQHLVAEARKALRAEIARNASIVDDAVRAIERQIKEAKDNIAALQPFQRAHEGPQDTSKLDLTIAFRRIELNDTSWRTAQATGALSFMPYEETKIYSTIYSLQAALLRDELSIIEDVAQISGQVAQADDGDDLVTAAEASALARCYGVMRGHLLNLLVSGRAVSIAHHAFLENRWTPGFVISATEAL